MNKEDIIKEFKESQYERQQKEQAKEQASLVSDMANNMSFNEKAFAKAMTREHRTLQQSFTRVCIAWLKECGSEEYRFDLRNKGSNDIGKAITEFLKTYQGGLPFV